MDCSAGLLDNYRPVYHRVSGDGDRFLINQVDAATEPVIKVVVNWEAGISGGQ